MQHEKKQLHSIIPYQSMIRWPSLQSLDDVPIDYIRNCIDLSLFLRSSFNVNSQGNLEISGAFRAALDNTDVFTEWLLTCHRIVCTGPDGNRPYGGRSEANIIPSTYAGNMRDSDTQVIAVLHRSQQKNIINAACHYSDPLAENHVVFDGWNDARKGKTMVKFLRMNGIHGPGLEALDIGQMPGPYKSSAIKKEVARNEQYRPNLSGNILYAAPSSEVIFYYPPGEEYIPQYLNLMREKFNSLVQAIAQKDGQSALYALAGYYQAGIRSQAVRGIWNSVLMGQVNEMRSLMGLNRLPHMELDFLAFCLKEELFARLFYELGAGEYEMTG